MRCENCGKQATIHLTEIKNGVRVERHLCPPCAMAAESGPEHPPVPVADVLQRFVDETRRRPPDRPE